MLPLVRAARLGSHVFSPQVATAQAENVGRVLKTAAAIAPRTNLRLFAPFAVLCELVFTVISIRTSDLRWSAVCSGSHLTWRERHARSIVRDGRNRLRRRASLV